MRPSTSRLLVVRHSFVQDVLPPISKQQVGRDVQQKTDEDDHGEKAQVVVPIRPNGEHECVTQHGDVGDHKPASNSSKIERGFRTPHTGAPCHTEQVQWRESAANELSLLCQERTLQQDKLALISKYKCAVRKG